MAAPKPNNFGNITRVEFTGSLLKQDRIAFNHKTIVDLYIIYEITKNNPTSTYPTLENCLFGTVK